MTGSVKIPVDTWQRNKLTINITMVLVFFYLPQMAGPVMMREMMGNVPAPWFASRISKSNSWTEYYFVIFVEFLSPDFLRLLGKRQHLQGRLGLVQEPHRSRVQWRLLVLLTSGQLMEVGASNIWDLSMG